MSSNIIQTKNLTYSYDHRTNVLDRISLNVPKGSIYGFLGANGSGKSTTIRLLTGIISDSKQCISLFDKPLQSQLPHVFKRIGCLIESPSTYNHLSGFDNLKYIAKMKGISIDDISSILNLVGLSGAEHQKVKNYSLGMKQRLGIGIALIGNPDLLLLDEPINGLDPQGIIDIRKLIIKLNKDKGITIFISSHLLDEIERICTHIGILDQGKIIFEGSMNSLKEKRSDNQELHIKLKNSDYWYDHLKKICQTVKKEDDWIKITTKDHKHTTQILKVLLDKKAIITEFKTNNNLENIFLQLTN